MHIKALLAASFVALLVLACSSSSSTPAGGTSCGSPGRSGKSMCFQVRDACGAGQYCSSGNGTGCSVGCTSDENCGSTEHCVRCGTLSVGTCQSCSDTADHCTSTVPDAGPTDPCSRDTATDFMCNTTPATPKAYLCFGKDPIQTGCVHAMGDPTVFCCAK